MWKLSHFCNFKYYLIIINYLIGNLNKCYCWGRNDYGELGIGENENQLIPIENKNLKGKSITQLFLGGYFTIALSSINNKPKSFIIKLKRKDFIDIKIKLLK